jgi:hypothetical protein
MTKLYTKSYVRECFACPLMKILKINPPFRTCGHPYFRHQTEHNSFITEENGRNRLPSECPLRTEPIDIVKTLEVPPSYSDIPTPEHIFYIPFIKLTL